MLSGKTENVTDPRLTDFEQYLRHDRRLSPLTVNNYLVLIGHFREFIQKDFHHVTREDVRDFIKHLEEKKLCAATASNYIIAFRSFYSWLADLTQENDLMLLSFFLTKIMRIKRSYKVPVVPTIAEIQELRKTLSAYKIATSFNRNSKMHKTILRDIAMIELLITTGLRSGELRGIRYCDVDLEREMVYVLAGKGGYQRVSIFSGTATAALQELFANSNFSTEDLLFPIKQGNLINYAIKQWAKRANINQKIHAHSFRHFFITESQRQGVDIQSVADQVGHRNLNTTRHYTHLNIEFRRSKFEKIII